MSHPSEAADTLASSLLMVPPVTFKKWEPFSQGDIKMLRAAIAFFVLGLIAVLFGANGFAGVSMEVGKLLLTVFLVLAVLSAVIGLVTGRGSKGLL